MDFIHKFQQIVQIQNENSDKKIGKFLSPITEGEISQIEKLLDEPLSKEFKQLYYFSNGQSENGKGVLFGERLISAEEIIRQLEFSRTLVKPKNRTLDNPEKSAQLIKEIVDFYIKRAIGERKNWFKLEFNCGIGTYGGPYVYAEETTTPKEREISEIEFKAYNDIAETIKILHELEKSTYNWDGLKFVVFSSGKYDVERTFYDFDNKITFTSTPENAIKKQYFHYKWLPLFSDIGGNYIGIDFDPDKNGKKGQIINFGQNEEQMFVMADSLEEFFDLVLTEIKKPNNKLMNTENHVHDILRELKNNCA